jgi:lipid-A-disaccharide synthase
MRYFFSTGEASGELTAVALAEAIARLDPAARFEGIGSNRMRAAGFTIRQDTGGWASMGPLAAIPRIPKLLAIGLRIAAELALSPPDLVVLVDFGAFNVRLAKVLRAFGFRKPVIDLYPPGTWLDDPKRAKAVARVAIPLTAFAHQRDFFAALGLPIAYFGHPLADRYAMRPPRPAPPSDGGNVAILPGSRPGELKYHVPLLLRAFALLKAKRPRLRAIAGPADGWGEGVIREAAAREGVTDIAFAAGTGAAIADADAAWVSSGTAVLECALSAVPLVALYVVSPGLEAYAQRLRAGRFIALPNLVMRRRIVPELLQELATPERLAEEMEALLLDPSRQYAEFVALREELGPPGAIDRCAAFAFGLAKSGTN